MGLRRSSRIAKKHVHFDSDCYHRVVLKRSQVDNDIHKRLTRNMVKSKSKNVNSHVFIKSRIMRSNDAYSHVSSDQTSCISKRGRKLCSRSVNKSEKSLDSNKIVRKICSKTLSKSKKKVHTDTSIKGKKICLKSVTKSIQSIRSYTSKIGSKLCSKFASKCDKIVHSITPKRGKKVGSKSVIKSTSLIKNNFQNNQNNLLLSRILDAKNADLIKTCKVTRKNNKTYMHDSKNNTHKILTRSITKRSSKSVHSKNNTIRTSARNRNNIDITDFELNSSPHGNSNSSKTTISPQIKNTHRMNAGGDNVLTIIDKSIKRSHINDAIDDINNKPIPTIRSTENKSLKCKVDKKIDNIMNYDDSAIQLYTKKDTTNFGENVNSDPNQKYNNDKLHQIEKCVKGRNNIITKKQNISYKTSKLIQDNNKRDVIKQLNTKSKARSRFDSKVKRTNLEQVENVLTACSFQKLRKAREHRRIVEEKNKMKTAKKQKDNWLNMPKEFQKNISQANKVFQKEYQKDYMTTSNDSNNIRELDPGYMPDATPNERQRALRSYTKNVDLALRVSSFNCEPLRVKYDRNGEDYNYEFRTTPVFNNMNLRPRSNEVSANIHAAIPRKAREEWIDLEGGRRDDYLERAEIEKRRLEKR